MNMPTNVFSDLLKQNEQLYVRAIQRGDWRHAEVLHHIGVELAKLIEKYDATR